MRMMIHIVYVSKDLSNLKMTKNYNYKWNKTFKTMQVSHNNNFKILGMLRMAFRQILWCNIVIFCRLGNRHSHYSLIKRATIGNSVTNTRYVELLDLCLNSWQAPHDLDIVCYIYLNCEVDFWSVKVLAKIVIPKKVTCTY